MTELNLDNMTTGLAIELAPRRPPERTDADSGASFQEHWQRTQAATAAGTPVERQPPEDGSPAERPVADQGAAEQVDSSHTQTSEPSSGDSPQSDLPSDTESDKSQEEPIEEPTADTVVPAANAGAVATAAQALATDDIELAAVGSSHAPPLTEPDPAAGKPAATKSVVPSKPVATGLAASDASNSATPPIGEGTSGTTDGESPPIEVDAAREAGSKAQGADQVTLKNAAQSEPAGSNAVQQAAPKGSALNVLPVAHEPTIEQDGRKPPTAPRQDERAQNTSPVTKAPPLVDSSAPNSPSQSAIDSIAATTVAVDGTKYSSHEQRTQTDGPSGGAADRAATPHLTVPSSDQPSNSAETPIVGTSNNSGSVKAERRDAWTLGMQGDAGAESSRGLTDVERARLVQRVAGAFQAASERGAPIRLRLSPPELGSLRLEMVVRDGMMHARLEAESRQTQTLLIDNLPALRERLAAQDIRLGAFDVGLMNSTSGGLPQRSQDQGLADQGGRFGGPREETNDALSASAAAEPMSLASTGRLNVVI